MDEQFSRLITDENIDLDDLDKELLDVSDCKHKSNFSVQIQNNSAYKNMFKKSVITNINSPSNFI